MLIEDLTAAIGRYVWLQRHLAGCLQDWATADGSADGAVAVYLHSTARRFADHSDAWEGLLADSPALAAAGQVRPPEPPPESLPAAGSPECLPVLVNVVLPRLADSVERFASGLGRIAEAAEARHSAIVVRDLRCIEARGRSLSADPMPALASPRDGGDARTVAG